MSGSIWTAIVGTVLGCAYAVVLGLQILVWNPMEVAQGQSLAGVHAHLASAGEELNPAFPLVAAGIGIALSVLLLVFVITGAIRGAGVVIAYLGMLIMGLPAYWASSFGIGMSLADGYNVSGGDRAPGGLVLALVSAAALLGLVVLAGMRSVRRTLPRSAGGA